MVDEFVIVYPNIEAFYLESSTMYLTEADTDCLSAIHFKRLTSLGLEGFYLKDGSFLLPVTNTVIATICWNRTKLLFTILAHSPMFEIGESLLERLYFQCDLFFFESR